MRRHPADLAATWLTQAERDLDDARYLAERRSFAAACFSSQQSAEKALKGYLIYAAGDSGRTHVVAELLATAARADASLAVELADVSGLDQFYVTTRYPGALGGALPAASFHAADADLALARAARTIEAVRRRLPRPAELHHRTDA